MDVTQTIRDSHKQTGMSHKQTGMSYKQKGMSYKQTGMSHKQSGIGHIKPGLDNKFLKLFDNKLIKPFAKLHNILLLAHR